MNPKLLFASCALFLTSCIHGNDEQSITLSDATTDITISEARCFYENEILSRADTECKCPDMLSPGDYTPQWDNAQISQNYRIACVDVPIIPTYRYRAIRSEFRRGQAQAYIVNVSQKVVIVKDRESGAMASYIMSLIPDKEFAAKHKGDISDLFLNANDRGRFSGMIVYTHQNFPICVSTYDGGRQLSNISLCDNITHESIISRLNILYKQLQNIKFIKKHIIFSRSESDYEYDDDLENENENENENEENKFSHSLLAEDAQGNLALYVFNEETNEYDQWHVWFASIDCTVHIPKPDDVDEPPTGQKDPSPENGENDDNQNDGGESNGGGSGTGNNNGNNGNTNNSTYGGIIDGIASVVSDEVLSKLMRDNKNVQFVVNKEIPVMNINFTVISSGNNHKVEIRYIEYNPQDLKSMNKTGIVMALLHEFMHPYLGLKGQSGTGAEDHQKFVKDGVYINTIRELFPNEDDDFYDIVVYAGCVDCKAFNELSSDRKHDIEHDLNIYLYK